MSTLVAAAPPHVAADRAHRPRWSRWGAGLVVLGLLTAVVTAWGVWSGSRSDYYASIAVSMSQNWSNFFFGSFDPAGTVTLDKIPGSFWIPALFVKVFGFSDVAVILPNALAAVGATLIVAVTAKRLSTPTAGLIAGAIVASTPILVAVSRSNQPESFFVLGLALTAWAATEALRRRSLGWLVASGLFIAVSFQTYMLEAWAVWPALAGAYLCTRQPVLRRIWHTALAGVVSLAASLTWIVIVSLVPATDRPYIGSTLHNDPWEMVFGYNGLGRFGSDTADTTAYRSFTPPFSGSAGVFRLLNEQVAGQIAWLIPTALLAVVVLFVLRFSRPIAVLIGVWLLTFLAMFSAVAGMHQFYTAALAVPMALAIGWAFGVAHRRGVLWAQTSMIGVAGVTALMIGVSSGGYSVPVSILQALIAAVTITLLVWEKRRTRRVGVTTLLAVLALVLTPAVWSVVTMAHPSAVNPVAGGVSDVGFGGQNRLGVGGGGFGGAGVGGQPGVAPGGAGGFARQGGPGAPPQDGSRAARSGGVGPGTGLSDATLSWLKAQRGDADYLVAAFGAQSAAGIILDSGGDSVLPIGGFNSGDPVPTLAAFESMVSSGGLRYDYAPDLVSADAGASSSEQIRAWVGQNCTVVTELPDSGIYDCAQ